MRSVNEMSENSQSDVEKALRLGGAGFHFASSEPFQGSGKVHVVARRLLQVVPGEYRYNLSEANIVARVIFFADKVLYLRTQEPHLSPKATAFWNKVCEIVATDKTVKAVPKDSADKVPQAISTIVEKYRVARENFIRRSDDHGESVAAPENETTEARIERERDEFKLRKLWSILEQLQELKRIAAHEQNIQTHMRNKKARESINEQDNEITNGGAVQGTEANNAGANNASSIDSAVYYTVPATQNILFEAHQYVNDLEQAHLDRGLDHFTQRRKEDMTRA